MVHYCELVKKYVAWIANCRPCFCSLWPLSLTLLHAPICLPVYYYYSITGLTYLRCSSIKLFWDLLGPSEWRYKHDSLSISMLLRPSFFMEYFYMVLSWLLNYLKVFFNSLHLFSTAAACVLLHHSSRRIEIVVPRTASTIWYKNKKNRNCDVVLA